MSGCLLVYFQVKVNITNKIFNWYTFEETQQTDQLSGIHLNDLFR
jgi:hypothetical protein